MSGYTYNSPEPKSPCPFCGTLTWADFVDVGVGFTQCGPYHCDKCGAYQIGPNDEPKKLTEDEQKYGWYEPATSKKFTSGNVINDNFVTHEIARKKYRESYGVYDDQQTPIPTGRNEMSEKLTKKALKNELERRIDWIEKAFPSINYETRVIELENKYSTELLGIYRCLKTIKWQIENNLFIDGYLK